MKLKKLLKHQTNGLQIVKLYRGDSNKTKKVFEDRAYCLLCNYDFLESKVISWCFNKGILIIYLKGE